MNECLFDFLQPPVPLPPATVLIELTRDTNDKSKD